MLEMVEFYHTTCRLNLAYNSRIKIRGWQAVTRTLKKVKKKTFVVVFAAFVSLLSIFK